MTGIERRKIYIFIQSHIFDLLIMKKTSRTNYLRRPHLCVSINSLVPVDQVILAALNDVCPVTYVNIFQSGLSKVNAGPPEVPYWNTY